MDNLQQLITQAQEGDTRALNQLFSRWYTQVYNIAYRYFSDADTARDVSQQIFLTVQQKLRQLKDPASFKVWLYRTAMNHCHVEARKAKTRQRSLESYGGNSLQPLAPSAEELYQREERAHMVLAALQRIPEEQRSVIIMKEYGGLKFSEIAEALSISENTVKSRMYYGLKALRKFFLTNNLKKEIYHE